MKNLKEIPDTNFRNELKKLFYNAFENELLDVNNEEVVNCETLSLYNLNIKDLTGIEYFLNLEYLDCSYNRLTSLSNLPDTLKELYCYNNSLTTLPNLPKTLEYLDCSYNRLTSLSNLPSTLKKLYCYNNQLTTLPTLPDTLEYLDCHYNNLTALPNLPDTLKGLYCHYNRFTNNENIFIDSKNNVIIKQNDIFFSGCCCNKTATEAKKLCLEHGYNEAIEYFSL